MKNQENIKTLMTLMGGRVPKNILKADINIGDSMSNIDAMSNIGGKENSKKQKMTKLPSISN